MREQGKAPAERQVRVLIGCADPSRAEAYVQALHEVGYQARSVGGWTRLMAEMDADAWDVLVLDGRWASEGIERFAELRAAASGAMWIVISPADLLPTTVSLVRFDVAEFLVEPVTPVALQEAVTRVLERARERHEVARLQALVPLYRVSHAFMVNLHLEDLLQRIVETAVAATGAQRGSLMLIDEDRQELTVQAAVGMPPEVMAVARERVGQGIAGWVARTGVPLVINNEGDIPPFLRSALRGGMAHSAVCLPLTVKGRTIGVMNLTKTADQPPFTRGDAELLSVLAGQAAIAIENARLFEEMERAYKDLQELDHMKSEFINVAAHELRTPVAIMLGYASLLVEQTDRLTADSMREYAEVILRNAERLQRITDDLLALENLNNWQPSEEAGELRLIPVGEVIQRAVAEFTPAAEERGLSLEVEAIPEGVMIWGDELKVALILRNLLSNAVKFTPSGGRVVLSVEPSEEEVVIVVADTGPGVDPEKRRYIFQPFYQAEPSLTRTHPGLGLGLSIARRLAELHGGRLWLEDRPGFGAVFCLALPRKGSAH